MTECLREQHFSISSRLINFRKSRNKIEFMKGFLSYNKKYQVSSLFGRSGSVRLTVAGIVVRFMFMFNVGREICNMFAISYHVCLLFICWWLCEINTHWC